MDFDETRLYFSHQQLQRKDQEGIDDPEAPLLGDGDEDDDAVDLKAVRRHFREFLSKS
jgi:hypothetical protein